jgi:hypothetical protein
MRMFGRCESAELRQPTQGHFAAIHNVIVSNEVARDVAFPFPDGRFPPSLGAVVQRTVLTGQEPARVVIHDDENDWLVGDGVNDPTAPGASVIACISHVAEADSSVAELTTLPIGYMAQRDEPDQPWVVSVHEYPD